MKQTKLDWFKLSPTFMREMCRDLDAPAIAAVLMFMAHQAENPLPDYNPRAISFACGVHWPHDQRDQDQVLRFLPRIGEYSCGFEFIELCKVALERNKNEGAIGGRKSAQLRAERRQAKIQPLSGQGAENYHLPAFAGVQRPLEPPLGGGLGTPHVNGAGVATPLEGPLEQREREREMRAPGPPPSSGFTPVVVGPDPLVPSSEAQPADGPPSSGTGFADGDKFKGDWVCIGCGHIRTGDGLVGVSRAPLCGDCDLARVPSPLALAWVDAERDAWLLANEPFRRGKPRPVTPATRYIEAITAGTKKVSADPAVSVDSGSQETRHVPTKPGGSEVPVSRLPRSNRRETGPPQLARPDVRKVQARNAGPVLVATGPKSKGKVAAKVRVGKAAAKLKPGPKPKPKGKLSKPARR